MILDREFATEYCATADIPRIEGSRILNKRLHVLASNETPFDFQQKSRVKVPRIPTKIRRSIEASSLDEIKVEKDSSSICDCFASRAFKEYIIKNKIEDFTGLDHIPSLSQRPNSLFETNKLINDVATGDGSGNAHLE